MPPLRELPCNELRLCYTNGESTITLARRFRCSPTTVANALRRCGVRVRPARFKPVVVPEEMLRDLYLNQRLRIGQIAAHFGVSASSIGNKRRAYGIPARSRSM